MAGSGLINPSTDEKTGTSTRAESSEESQAAISSWEQLEMSPMRWPASFSVRSVSTTSGSSRSKGRALAADRSACIREISASGGSIPHEPQISLSTSL